jgi:DNA-binding HxlR family transcriptional regulator
VFNSSNLELRDATFNRKLSLMRRKTFARMNCSIARALELVGEWWTMLIMREAFLGTRRFHDFQCNLGIARNILSARLKKLVARGILERVAGSGGGRRLEYRLTDKGRDFFPVLMALMQWGDRWVAGSDRAPLKVIEESSGSEIAEIQVTTLEGKPLRPIDVRILPGPGAAASTRARFGMSQHREPELPAGDAVDLLSAPPIDEA